MRCVILAGGSGSRFWPYSRSDRPKQLLKIVGEKSMLQMTVDRLKKIKKITDIYIITRKDLYDQIVNEIEGVAIMTDTDNSKILAISYYQNIYFSTE